VKRSCRNNRSRGGDSTSGPDLVQALRGRSADTSPEAKGLIGVNFGLGVALFLVILQGTQAALAGLTLGVRPLVVVEEGYADGRGRSRGRAGGEGTDRPPKRHSGDRIRKVSTDQTRRRDLGAERPTQHDEIVGISFWRALATQTTARDLIWGCVTDQTPSHDPGLEGAPLPDVVSRSRFGAFAPPSEETVIEFRGHATDQTACSDPTREGWTLATDPSGSERSRGAPPRARCRSLGGEWRTPFSRCRYVVRGPTTRPTEIRGRGRRGSLVEKQDRPMSLGWVRANKAVDE
jgi:hypothetical protein